MRKRVLLVVLALAVLVWLYALQPLREAEPTQLPEPQRIAWPIVRGSVSGADPHWYVAFEHRAGVKLCPVEETKYGTCEALDALPFEELLSLDAGAWSKVSTFRLDARLEGEVPAAALALSSYVTRLTEDSRLVPISEREFDSSIDALVSALRPDDDDKTLDEDELRSWALANAKNERLFEAFLHHRVTGTCSVDPVPHFTAVAFAELALARGDTPTFVDLQLRLINGSFERVAWSSFSDDSQPTRAERLAANPSLDVEALLLGLVIQHRGSKNVTERRIARAMREAGKVEALLPRLEALATSKTLDPYDRYRAANVWLSLQLFDEQSFANAAAVRERAAKLDLDFLSRTMVDRVTSR